MTGTTTLTGECLQCGETPQSIERNNIALCGIVSVGESIELVEEFPQHQWADWTDAQLTKYDLKPEAFDQHRRTQVTALQWVACEDTVTGHRLVGTPETAELFDLEIGRCFECGKTPTPQPADAIGQQHTTTELNLPPAMAAATVRAR